MAKVVLQDITKRFDETVAVKDLNLTIADREFLVLVGPSGCGKTTTLRMIAGLEEITQGEIYIGDRLVNNLPPKDRNIAMVFQGSALILGIRPEDLHEPHSGHLTSPTIRATVNVIETLGKEILLDITTGAHSLKALLGADTAVKHRGDIELVVNTDKIHLFHGEGGEAVI